jgi:hypothetical protein
MTRARRPQGHRKNDHEPPLGKRTSDSATLKMTPPNATRVTFVSAVISPKARSLDNETLGKSSIAVFICAEIGSSTG